MWAVSFPAGGQACAFRVRGCTVDCLLSPNVQVCALSAHGCTLEIRLTLPSDPLQQPGDVVPEDQVSLLVGQTRDRFDGLHRL